MDCVHKEMSQVELGFGGVCMDYIHSLVDHLFLLNGEVMLVLHSRVFDLGN